MSKGTGPSAGRTDILAAALREFSDHGFAGASTAGIARRAGVTQPLVHHHFGSKQGLWTAVCAEVFGALEAALAEARAGAEGLGRRERLTALLRALVLFSGRRPEFSRLIRAESSSGGATFAELYERWLSGLVDVFRQELGTAVKGGVLRPVDPHLAYPAIMGACVAPFGETLTVQRAFGLDMRDPAAAGRYADFVVPLLLRGLGPDDAPAAPPRLTSRRTAPRPAPRKPSGTPRRPSRR